MFGTSGIRGPVGETVSGALALSLGRALGSMNDRIVVGRDARESGDALARAAVAGAQEAGSDVVDLGVESTPTVARAVEWYDGDAGLVVTTSHNPPADNGFKFWTRAAQAFGPDANAELTRRVGRSADLTVEPAEMGSVTRVCDASQRHLDRLPDGDLDLSVVVDVGNGTGRLTADALIARGCDVITIDTQRDGSFPGRPSEPTPEHCPVLAGVVADTGADFGVAHDGDADRMVAVDGTGSFVSGDELLAVFALDALESGGAVAVPVNASALVDRVVEARGGSVVRTAVGDGNVAAACTESGVVFGGEPSGAWIWPDQTLAPDGHYAACALADLVAAGDSLAVRIGSLPHYVTKRKSIECEPGHSRMSRIEPRLRERYDAVTVIDGLRVDFDDGRFLIRESGTKPLLRLTAEAETEPRAAELLSEATALADGELPALKADTRGANRS